jgi:hypothetical protein
MNSWQMAITIATAAACLIAMAVAVIRLQTRRGGGTGTERPGTALESGAYGATAAPDQRVTDAWSYRVGARFAGRVRIVTGPERIVVCGPRVPGNLYDVWIWLQALTLALVPALLVLAAVRLDWRALLLALGVFAVSFGIGSVGAGLWPGLGELPGIEAGRYPALDFPRSSVRDVKIGAGWADGGLGIVLLPYRAPIDAIARNRAVSWWAVDERGREVRFALHCSSDEAAKALAADLRGED